MLVLPNTLRSTPTLRYFSSVVRGLIFADDISQISCQLAFFRLSQWEVLEQTGCQKEGATGVFSFLLASVSSADCVFSVVLALAG